MRVRDNFTNAGCDQVCAGEYLKLSEYDTLQPGEIEQIVFGMLREMRRSLFDDDGTTVYVVVERDT